MENYIALGSHWEISFELKKKLYKALAKEFKKMHLVQVEKRKDSRMMNQSYTFSVAFSISLSL